MCVNTVEQMPGLLASHVLISCVCYRILAWCAYTDPSALEKCTKAAVSALRSATTVPHSFASVAAAAAAAAIVVAGSVRNAPV